MSGRIRKQELHSSVNNELDKIKENKDEIDVLSDDFVAHKDDITTEEGRHGIRYLNDELQIKVDEEWEDVKTGNPFPIGNVSDISASVSDETVRLSWKDPFDVTIMDSNNNEMAIARWGGTMVRRSVTDYPKTPTEGDLVVDSTTRNQYDTDGYEDTGLTYDTMYYYSFFPYTEDGVFTINAVNRVEAEPFNFGPGPVDLIGGDLDAGFFGEVDVSELINGSDLCSELGITQGNLQNSNEPYLKFAWKGKIQFVNKKAIRNNIGWDAIYEAGAVYGTGETISSGEQWMLDNDSNYSESDRVSQDAQVTINGLTYRVRLMRGMANDPTNSYTDSDRGSIGPDNEWNALMLPIHENAPDNWEYPDYVDSPTKDWSVSYTDEDLLTDGDYGEGHYSWTQETRDTSRSDRIVRGGRGVSNMTSYSNLNTGSHRGLRFVLEIL